MKDKKIKDIEGANESNDILADSFITFFELSDEELKKISAKKRKAEEFKKKKGKKLKKLREKEKKLKKELKKVKAKIKKLEV